MVDYPKTKNVRVRASSSRHGEAAFTTLGLRVPASLAVLVVRILLGAVHQVPVPLGVHLLELFAFAGVQAGRRPDDVVDIEGLIDVMRKGGCEVNVYAPKK